MSRSFPLSACETVYGLDAEVSETTSRKKAEARVAAASCAYFFALNSVPSTVPPVFVAHSFAAPLSAVSVTPVPPIAHALEA
jgi:hypothetical protein